jgi:16S rRNA (cytosine967-C5)-methyltransferase
VLGQGERADHLLSDLLRARPTWDADSWVRVRDAVHDVVRRRLLLEGAAGSDDPSRMLAVWHLWRGLRVPAPFGRLDEPAMRRKLEELAADFRIRESLPAWLDEQGTSELGTEAWRALIPHLNEPARLYVRANTLRTTRADLATRLRAAGAEVVEVEGFPDALELRMQGSVYATPEHAAGLMEVQDAASQAVSRLLGVSPGMRVVDGCAGAGGKTLHLAALMSNKGRLLALDTDAAKLETLRQRARKAGAAVVEARVVDTTKVVKRRHGTADRLLLDVPCSGLGVLRRNPETRWRLSRESLDRLRALQREILARYAPLVKPGGTMAYVTCSVLPSEGEGQVRWFLQERADSWTLDGEYRFGPPRHDTDCFYVAVLSRRT